MADEMAPFVRLATEKYIEGDYNATRDLAEEMIKRSPANAEALRLREKSVEQLGRLAEHATFQGNLLASMNLLDQAVSYWQRGMNYVREGDPLYEELTAKLKRYR